jgi:hypothetical protein
LIFACRCGDDHVRLRHQIGSPERSESGLSVYVDIYIEMANGSDAFLGPFPAAGDKWIGGDIDVCAIVVFVGEPAAIAGSERTL